MKGHIIFETIEFTRDTNIMREWFPFIMHDRKEDEIMAASRIERGTEVNYGFVTEQLYHILETAFDTKVQCNKEAIDIDPDTDLEWSLKVKDTKKDGIEHLEAQHILYRCGWR